MPPSQPDQPTTQTSGFFRRVAAILYDSLLLFAVLFVSTIPVVIIAGGYVKSPLYSLFIYGIGFVFFGWFWTHGGQTLGMRSWRLKVIHFSGKNLTWKDALIRYLSATLSLAMFGAGFFWMLFDRDKLALHDRLSRTRIVHYHN